MIGNYKVITLCGSTRFKDEFLQVQKELTLQGNIVISVGLFGHAGDFEVWENMNEGTLTKTKEMLDDMHKRKIDSDNYLLKIISDTNSFAKDVLMSDTIDYGYFIIEVNDDEPLFINLELHGGWMSDTIYIYSKGRYISKHLIKTIFGKETIIELKIDEVERITDDNICSFDYRYYIYMQGFSENLNMIKNSILGGNKKLVKKRRKGDIV